MISRNEFQVLHKYKELLDAWAMGRSVQVTRATYGELEPIVKKHTNRSFTLTCAACTTKLIKHAHDLYYEYANRKNNKKDEKGK